MIAWSYRWEVFTCRTETRGYSLLSPVDFIWQLLPNNANTWVCNILYPKVLHNVFCTNHGLQILVTDKKIDQVNDLIPLLEAMVQAKEPLLVVAEDVVGEALSALVVNKMRGVLDVVGTAKQPSCAFFLEYTTIPLFLMLD